MSPADSRKCSIRPGYEWDVGVHYIGNVHDLASQERKMFDHITEGRLAWNRYA